MKNITSVMALLTVILLTACNSANNLSTHSCRMEPVPDKNGNTPIDTRSPNEKTHGCSKFNAAVNTAVAIAEVFSQSYSKCKQKSGKARQECEQQVQAISDSIKKHTKK
ncbi:hypothetical protein [Parashewanella tropica]|uniref:hypothetical protein n=1 Tax=Parashewanella tropica TaxID=2547970 RepID=UPI001059495D|nr:hypothetical protein [Parashewanella tropica]